MHNKRWLRLISVFLVVIVLSAALTGCKNTPAVIEPSATAKPATEQPTIAPTAASPRLVMVDPTGMVASEIVELVAGFAANNALVFENLPSLSVSELSAESKIVVFLAQPTDLNDLLNAAPGTQFIVVGGEDPNGRANLSVIQSRAEDLAFMAGYITTNIAWDWRSGGLLVSDGPLGAGYFDAFENGGRLMCGQCSPYYSPYYYFPYIIEQPLQSPASSWVEQLPVLTQYWVDAVFVDPSVASPEVVETLKASEFTLIGQSDPSVNPADYAALLGFDLLPGLQSLLPQALAGTGGNMVRAQVKLVTINDESVITPARQSNFLQTASELAEGWVVPLSVQ